MNALNIFYLVGRKHKKMKKKKGVVAKRRGIGAFVLYVQIKIGRIFTRSRA